MASKRRGGRLSEVTGCPLRYLEHREFHSSSASWNPNAASSAFLSRRLASAETLYQKDLHAHYGCVNAIEFSSEGDLLVSGGDDRRVLLWDVDMSFSGKRQPRAMKGEHNSNIFSLSFDGSNKKAFSAGNDGKVIAHDLKTGEALDMFLHDLAVYGVTVHPTTDTIFASAGEDGHVLLYDTRAPSSTDPLTIARGQDAFHAVQFHPIEPIFLVTANSRAGISLWDVRKPGVPVLRYGDKKCAQSSMSARFNCTGTQIIALRRRLPPVLYNTQSTTPICQFDADHYYNSCTMKSCCFAGDKDQFVLSGSDDFNLYVWKIPAPDSEVNFVSDAHLVLRGHRSIVNQVRFNPQNFIIASSGVEKVVKLWSGLALPGCSRASPCMTRKVFTHEEYIGLVMESGQNVNHDYSNGSTDEDPRMMAFFDSLVQREVEGCTSNTDISEDEPAATPAADTLRDDDVETTTTQSSSSVLTSQSDEDMSGESEVDNGSSNKSAAVAGASSQSSSSSRPRRRGTRLRSNRPRTHDSDKDDDDDDDDDTKPSGGDWILKLIAKKRAQLKAAKRARRHQKHLSKTQFLSSFTCHRQYYYHPDGIRTRPEGESSYIIPIVNDSNRSSSIHGAHRKRLVAPYTIMVVHDSEDNAENTYNNGESSTRETDANRLSQKRSHTEVSGDHLWSSDSSSSSDENAEEEEDSKLSSCHKRKRNFILDTDSENSDVPQAASNGHIISEVIDTDDSDNGDKSVSKTNCDNNSDKRQSASSSKWHCNNFIASSSNARKAESTCASNDLHSSSINNCTNIELNGHKGNSNESDIDIDNNINDVIPISGISTDDNGSILFDLDQNSLGSGFDMQNSMDVYLPSTPKCKLQNGSNNKNNNRTNDRCNDAETPDSGVVTMPSSTEKSEDESPGCSSSSTSSSFLPNATKAADSVSSSLTQLLFSYTKKRVPKCGLKNYRLHSKDDDA